MVLFTVILFACCIYSLEGMSVGGFLNSLKNGSVDTEGYGSGQYE